MMMSTEAGSRTRVRPELVSLALGEGPSLRFRPEPPGDKGRLKLPEVRVAVDVTAREWEYVLQGLECGALDAGEVEGVLDELRSRYRCGLPERLASELLAYCGPASGQDVFAELRVSHRLEELALVTFALFDRAWKTVMERQVEPFSEIVFDFTPRARIALLLGCEAMTKHGRFPLRPQGPRLARRLAEEPVGTLHFVSASDLDAGYYFTLGIALSPEAQAFQELGVAYGLDGELIVPGQAVSPIPPFLAMATRLFASSVPTSSNISEEIQAIPFSSFAQPAALDVAPLRGNLFPPDWQPTKQVEKAREELEKQLARYRERGRQEALEFLPDVGGALDVSPFAGAPDAELEAFVGEVLAPLPPEDRARVALYLLLTPDPENARATETAFAETPRYKVTCRMIDVAKRAGLRFVAVADQDEDAWLPNLLEYFTSSELNRLADYSDARGVILCDGRPVDPSYTAATSAQRIQSVYTTLSVDILKMGMWLCMDALTARAVWKELMRNPHIPERMLLMPIGIIEPFSGFVDNRDRGRTPRALVDPFEKIEFMLEEAEALGVPALLTDTRHKSRWVLLGAVDGDLEPHAREGKGGATSLLGREKLLRAERLARRKGILLAQAGSIESRQLFWVISDTTYDAAREGLNPATAVWTAETERVLRTSRGDSLRGDLQEQRRAAILPYLALVNRTYESHARLDGWLRYLEDVGRGDEALRGALLRQRELLLKLQDDYVELQENDARTSSATEAYQRAWERFRMEFRDYHATLKAHLRPVRDRVAESWRVARASSRPPQTFEVSP
ncbi:hypothetical protein [Myxococcus sp. RHSTA-1-4]|uniref:hypothetical protein n=1 Tax=Myxococcus sp. RHSTA-1-4 TaxID=2874601 RepID=UPI001CC07C19|nr:hypothetical protein [Myxococcus sp. RHSTA-1-4]MBZ4418668.1 hypothetical protein [Myxococcus sp. RHSTA-1-4]